MFSTDLHILLQWNMRTTTSQTRKIIFLPEFWPTLNNRYRISPLALWPNKCRDSLREKSLDANLSTALVPHFTPKGSEATRSYRYLQKTTRRKTPSQSSLYIYPFASGAFCNGKLSPGRRKKASHPMEVTTKGRRKTKCEEKRDGGEEKKTTYIFTQLLELILQ